MAAKRGTGNSPTPTPSDKRMAGGDGGHRGAVHGGDKDFRQRAESADKESCTETEPADDTHRNSAKNERFCKGTGNTGSYILLTVTNHYRAINRPPRPVKQE